MHVMFRNPIWQALTTEQSSIALGGSLARRYPADVLPFCAVASPDERSMLALRDLVTPGEPAYLCTDGETPAAVPGLIVTGPITVPQMIWPTNSKPNGDSTQTVAEPPITALTEEDAQAMVGLTDIAFPGLFRRRTCTLGSYFGIRVGGELVAMSGERFSLCGFREISAVCTHPGHTGRGYAARLIRHVIADERARGVGSLLHVAGNNTRAIALYERLGFVRSSEILMYKLMLT